MKYLEAGQALHELSMYQTALPLLSDRVRRALWRIPCNTGCRRCKVINY